MTLSTKKVNITYAAYLLISVPITLLFLLSGIIARATNNDSIDYDTVLTMNEEYYIKVSDAVYIEDENTIKFKLSTKEMEYAHPTGDPPSLLSVWLDSSDNELDFASQKVDEVSTEYTCKISDEQKEFKRIIVRVQYKTPDEKQPDTTDKFGTVYEGEVVKGKELIERITISRDDITKMSAEENEHTVTEKVVLTTTTKVTTASSDDSSDDSSSDADSSESATTTTKNSTTTTDSREDKTTTETTTAGKNTDASRSSTATSSNGGGGGNTTKNTTQSTTKATTTATTKASTKATTKATTKPKQTATSAHGATPSAISMRTNSNTYDVYMKVGQSHKVQAVVSPSTSEQSVSWSSLRPNVATVDSNGNIKAIGKGTTIITVTTKNGGLKASCMVTVS